jgi:hypothetical protein
MSTFRLGSDDQFYFDEFDSFAGSDDRKKSQPRGRETPLAKLSKMESMTQGVGIYSWDRERKVFSAGAVRLRPKAGCSSAGENAVDRNWGTVDVQALNRSAAEPVQRPRNVAFLFKSSLMSAAFATSVAFAIAVFHTKVDTPNAPRFALPDSRPGTPPPPAQSSIDARDITFGIGNEGGNKDVAPASETASTADDQAFPSLSWTPFDPVGLEGGTLSSLNVEVDDGTRSPQQRFVRDWSTGSQSPKQDVQSRPPFNGRTAARPSLAR